uniref:Triosephosphate isomerase, cytosolic n=1 Tax=Lactuca sativa TaxID=4236 RepID=A0A9R1XXF6_LACSA|nr:hypothetical protein LSAT_V11C100009010 [Lactuca sativa]
MKYCEGFKYAAKSRKPSSMNPLLKFRLPNVVVSPPFVFLTSVKSELRPEIQVAAQNCWVKKGGAFTGEFQAALFKVILEVS